MALNMASNALIEADGTTSGPVDLTEWLLAGFMLPDTFTGTALTFEAAPTEDGTYRSVTNSSGTAISVTVATDAHVLIEPQTFAGVRWLKIVSGSTEGADRTIGLVLHRREG